MKLTKNFSKSEFDSKDGAAMPDDVLENVKKLAEALQIVRDRINLPIRINSGYRSPSHNKAVGGSLFSQHLRGKAADIAVDDVAPDQVAGIIEALIGENYIPDGGIGRYNSFTHYDMRGHRARWDYRK